jgi:anion-transporting  ArsA/GET3 family ATPase
MADFLDGKVIQWFVKPYLLAGKVGFAFAQRSAALIFKFLERFTGYEAMADLAEFFLAFDGMYEGFKTRAVRVKELLGSPDTAFVLVTTPASPAIEEAVFFWRRLARERLTPKAVVFNRVHALGDGDPAAWARQARQAAHKVMTRHAAYAPAIDVLVETAAAQAIMAEADATAIERFLSQTNPRQAAYRVPAFAADVHDLRALHDLAQHLAD